MAPAGRAGEPFCTLSPIDSLTSLFPTARSILVAMHWRPFEVGNLFAMKPGDRPCKPDYGEKDQKHQIIYRIIRWNMFHVT